MKMKIGIMDSGLGGATVLRACLKELPNHEYLYFADSTNAPYGTKSKEVVAHLTQCAVDFLIEKGAQLIVLACNTATSAAVAMLRAQYDIPIIGMEPALKPGLEVAKNKRVLITATALTLSQQKFKDLHHALDVHQQGDFLPLTELVTYAETGVFDPEIINTYLKEKLTTFNLEAYGSIVLGCTHFPLFEENFKALFPKDVVIVDGTAGTVNRIKTFLTDESSTPSHTFYLSGQQVETGETYELFKKIIQS